jgi:nitroreductase
MVRSFTDAPVSPDAVERIIDIARRGPSAGYSQGVEFIVITDPEARAELGAAPSGRRHAARIPNFVAQAPVVVVICTSEEIYTTRYAEADKRTARGASPDAVFWMVPYWHVDAGAAMMLLLLATVAEGLGAGVAGVMGAAGQHRIRRLLGMPESYTAVAVVAIGHPAPDARKFAGSAATRKRRPQEEIVHRGRW